MKGMFMDGMINCPECKGKRTLFISAQIDSNTRSGTQIECPVCSGTGKVSMYGHLRKRRGVNILFFVASCVGMFVCLGLAFLLLNMEGPVLKIFSLVPGFGIILCLAAAIFSILCILDNSKRMKLLEMSGLTGEEKRKTSPTITDDGEMSLYQLIDGDEQIDSP